MIRWSALWTREAALLTASVLLVGGAGVLLGDRLDPTRHLATTHIERPTPFALPGFRLVDADGHALDSAELRGHVWVADFLFLQCGDTCARLSRRFLALQRATAHEPWGASLRFVSFSVDPDDDAPALARYRRAYDHAPDPRWHVLAADERAFPKLAVTMGLADAESDVPNAFVASSRYMFLVDADGIVRSRYDAFADADADRLERDLFALGRNEATP